MWNGNYPVLSIGISCLVSAIIAVLAGYELALATLALQFFGEALIHLRKIRGLSNWLKNPVKKKLPFTDGIWGDIYTRVRQLADQVETSEKKSLQALSQAKAAGTVLPDGLILLNKKCEIRWFNISAADFFDIVKSDIGIPVDFIIRHPEFKKILQTPQKQLLEEPTDQKITVRIKKPFSDLVISLQLLAYGNNERLVLARNITEFDRIETTRRDFIANVSHELRTPLTVIHGFLETIQEHDTNKELIPEALNLMSEQTVRMTRLVEDLLTLTKVESKGLRDIQDVDVPSILISLVNEARSLHDTRHELFIEHCDSAWLRGNAEELRSAFENLVSNAIRYTPKGGQIRLRWKKEAEKITFSVHDNGVGINALHIPRLTERFYRIDKSRSRGTGGTGLGLAIVKHVSMRHQAELKIESIEGKGSTFFIQFPKEIAFNVDQSESTEQPMPND